MVVLKKTDRPTWAGLPIEYWIDLEVLEESPLFEILEDLCHRFPERSRQQHIELIATRLTERGRKDEIGFSFVRGETTTHLTISDGLAQLRLPVTWNVNLDEHLLVWQKPRTLERLGRRFLNLWSRRSSEQARQPMRTPFLDWFKGRSPVFWVIALLFVLLNIWFDYYFPGVMVFDVIAIVVVFVWYSGSRHA
jgi:hypothetical protein